MRRLERLLLEELPSPFIWGGGAVIRVGGVRGNNTTEAHDPSDAV